MRATATLWRGLGAFAAIFLAGTALASAQVQVNKQFAPTSVALGATSVVTVTLQNSSTTSAATITAFSDDIATMSGHGTLLTVPAPSTTCTGGTPTISGTAVVMNNGAIPIAPNSSTPGTCTVTFDVQGSEIGNGFNTIPAASVTTSNGSPSSDVTQTLAVQSANVTAAAATALTVLNGDTTTVTYTITNPAAIALANTSLAISSNATTAYTVSGYSASSTCGGTAVLPAPNGTTGTTTLSGLTIPKSGSCTVILNVTTNAVETVNFTLAAGAITDSQAATNSVAVSAQAKFVNGQPNVTKSFAPTSIQSGGTSVLTIKIANVLTDQALDITAESDTLPTNLTIAPTPNASTTCTGGTVTAVAGASVVSLSGGVAAQSASCTITVSVTSSIAATYNNSIPAANFSGTTSVSGGTVTGAAAAATASLVVTASGGAITAAKAATPTSAGVNVPVKMTLTYTSQGGGVFTAGSVTDTFPTTPVAMVGYSDASHLPSFSAGCTGGTTPSFVAGYVTGSTSITANGMSIAANGTCVVTFYVEFPNETSVSRVDTNTAGTATFTGSAGTVSPASPGSVNVTETPTFTVTNYVASASGLTNQPLTVSATVNVPAGFSDTNASVTIPLTANKVALTAVGNVTFTNCPAGTAVTGTTLNGSYIESFTVSLGTTITQNCTIGYTVIDEGGAALSGITPGNPTYSSTTETAVATTGQNNVTFTAPSPILVTKSFTPNQIQAGGTATAAIALVVPQAGTLAITEAEGVAFADLLPTNMNFSTTPNVTFSAGCQQTGQPAPSFTIAGSRINVSNISLITNGTVETTCTVNFDVTSNVVGAPLNQIAAGAVTSTAGAGAANTQVAKASLTVSAGLGIAKTFTSPTLQLGQSEYVRFLVTNTATTSALSGGTLTDSMPASLVLASTTEGPIQAGDPVLCGGTISGTVGASSFTLTGLAIAGDGGSSSQCVAYVLVKPSATAVPGSVTNTIASGGLTIGGYSNQNAGSGSVTLTAPPNPTLTKAFLPTAIAPNGTSVLTISVANTATGAIALSGMTLTDTLPTGITIATTPNASTTCPSATVTAVAGSGSVAIAGGTVAAAASCTITVSVTSAASGSYVNTIPANSLTTTQGATNGSDVTATLQVAPPVTISKAFLPTSIASAGTSTLTVTVANTATGAAALSGVALTDTLPTGVTIAATPNAATSCSAGTVTAVAGSGSVALSGASLAASASCTFNVDVTGTTPSTYTNTIPASALTTTQGITNAAPATANLTITPAALTIGKAFLPTSIASGGTSVLTITIPNTASGSVALSALALTDTLPTGVTIAATPNASTTCTAGTVAAVAGSGSVALNGATLAAGASCTITVSVTGTIANTYTNTIPATSLTDTQNVSNGNTATAALTITPAALTIAKAFLPTSIIAGSSSVLTITIPNTASGSVALSALALTDTLPSGVTIAATPNASTTCPAGTVTAVAGSGSVALSGATLAASASCTITVSVTATGVTTYTNTIPATSLTDTQNVSNGNAATANLTITPATLTIAKAFLPTSITAGGTSVLTITIPNTATGAVALSAMALTDTLPTGVTIAATPNASTTCGAGTITAAAGTGSIALSGGAVAAAATCTITVSVTGTVANTYTNTIAISSLTDTQNVTNSNAAAANLTIAPAALTIAKAFLPTSIASGGTSVLTITIPNTATGAVALSAMALTDTLPSGVTIAATPNAATSCPAGTVTAVAGAGSVALSGGTLAAAATCTITVSVTGTVANTYTNTIPASNLTDTQNVTNGNAAAANLTIAPAALTIAKAFLPTSIASGTTSVLTITIPNTASGAVALSGIALTDTLPTGITIAATPNASTTCPTGTVTAVAGSGSVALSGATLAAAATCTITVSVTGTVANTYTNTIPPSSLTDTQNVTNGNAAAANLTIAPAGLTIAKAFLPTSIPSGGISTLTITIPNTASGSIALGAMALTDTLPTGVTVAATPNASTTCSGGTVTAAAASGSVALSGASLAPGATCTIKVDVTGTAVTTFTNTIPAASLTDLQNVSNSTAATANLTVTPAALTIAKAFSPISIPSGGTSTLTITIPNTAAGNVALSGVALTDTLPTGVAIAAAPNAATTCPAGTVTAVAGSGSIALSGATLAAGATCTVTVSVTGTVANTYTNTIGAASLTDTQSVTNGNSATANLTITPAATTLTKAFSPTAIVSGGTSLLTITIPNTASGAVALSGMSLSDGLPTGVTIAATPNAATTCPSGTVAAAAGGGSVSLSGATLAAGASCTITVNVTGTVANTYTNTIPATSLMDTQNVSNGTAATANLTITPAALTLTKAFLPTSIVSGSSSTLTITIPNTAAGSVALSGIALTDTLPTGITIAATPNAATTCPSGTVAATAGAGSVALSGATLAAGATCTIAVSVTGTIANTYTNTIPATSLSDAQNVSNGTAASANLTITPASLPIAKAFTPASIPSGGTSRLTITFPNTASGNIALSGIALTDTLPAGITIAATPNAVTTCAAGTITAAAGSGSVALNGASLAAGATCTVKVNVTGTVANAYTNTIPASSLTDTQNVSNGNAATATLTIAPAALTIAKAFAPTSITSGGSSRLTITIPNTASGSIALSAIALSDTLPTGVTIAATPNTATTCGAGTVSATAGGATVALSGGTLAAGATCTIKVNVTGSVANTYTNTIPATSLTDAQNVSNGNAATANLTIAPAALAIAKAFAPNAIASGGTSLLTITIPNTGAGAIALSGIALTDALPAGVTIAATPNAATSCGAGAIAAPAGGGSVALSGGSLAAGSTCTITVNVTGTVANTYTNTIPASSITDAQNVSNGNAASANLTIAPASLAIAKAFAPTSITSGGTSLLTITIPNTASGAIALSGMSLTDTLPVGITIAATPNAATTCAAGAVTANASSGSVALSGGSLAAGSTCTITVNVTGTIAGTYTNTIPAASIGDTQNVSNGNIASANLTIVPAGLTLAKAFAPTQIAAGNSSTLTITIPNTASGAINLTAVALTDTLPAGITIAATPNAATTCPGGSVSAIAGGGSVALSGASIAANASCTIAVSVTGLTSNTYTNTIPAGALTDGQNVTNPTPAIAALTIVPNNVVIAKAFAPTLIPVGGTSTLTITIPNTTAGAIALSGVGLIDTLPAGVVIAATPGAATTCPSGTVTANAGAASVALSGATLAAGATCTITVKVTSGTAGTYTNTIPAAGLTDAQGVSNAAPATAQLQVVAATLSVVKTSNPAGANVGPGQTITYTIAITNNGAVPETNASLTDTLVNATVVPGSVKVNNAAAPDGIVTSGTPFGTVAPGATTTIIYKAVVSATAPPGSSVTNSARVAGDVPCTGTTCTATSQANTIEPPSLQVVKTIDAQQGETVLRGQTVTFTMTITNSGAGSAQQVVLTDPVPAGITPIAGTATLNGAADAGASFSGQTVTVPVGMIAAGGTAVVTFQATIASSASGTPTNVVAVGYTGLAAAIHSNPVIAQIVPSTLQVTKTASATVVRVGDRVDYVIQVTASAGTAYGTTTVTDTLPDYELYAPGTARVNGKALEPVVHGRTLVWTLPNLTGTSTFSYATVIQTGAPQNQTLTNVVDVTAIAPGGAPAGRGHATAQVQTIGSTLGTCYPITGRVYLDLKGSGRYEDGDPGLPAVRIFLNDGQSVVTDAHGRYNFPCVNPGMHAMRLDETTLPPGVTTYRDHSIDSEKSIRRLVHRTYDDTIIEDINFALTGTLTTPPPPGTPPPPITPPAKN